MKPRRPHRKRRTYARMHRRMIAFEQWLQAIRALYREQYFATLLRMPKQNTESEHDAL